MKKPKKINKPLPAGQMTEQKDWPFPINGILIKSDERKPRVRKQLKEIEDYEEAFL